MKLQKYTIPQGTELPKFRKHLNADMPFCLIRAGFARLKDPRSGKVQISLADSLMSGFAMFALKDPSLLAFDQRRKQNEPNLKRIFGIERAPCDTQMREVPDEVDPAVLRAPFNRILSRLQRGSGIALSSPLFGVNYW